MEDLPLILAILVLLMAGILMSFWAINDGRRRGKSPFLVWTAVVAFFPLGLLIWLLFRPAPIPPRLIRFSRDPAIRF